MKMTQEQIAEQVDNNLTVDSAEMFMVSLLDCLWGEDSDHDWGPDTLDAIIDLLEFHGFGPNQE